MSVLHDAVAPKSQLLLMINQAVYRVRPILGGGSDTIKAFRLNKPDGTLYDVALTPFGVECDCPDFIFRREGLDPAGCKHVKALVAQGLLDPPTGNR